MRLYEVIEGRMAISIHMGDSRPQYQFSQPEKLARICDKFPKLKVIAPHLGGYLSWKQAEFYLYGRPNVWYDTSSALHFLPPETGLYYIRACGIDKVIFGTDYPCVSLETSLNTFFKCDLTEEERADILYYNAKKFLSVINTND
jgi:predicted TIM-barrel fold metal-dependent hydrolase